MKKNKQNQIENLFAKFVKKYSHKEKIKEWNINAKFMIILKNFYMKVKIIQEDVYNILKWFK